MQRSNPFAFSVIAWHNDSVNGTHHSIIAHGSTISKAIKAFNTYMQRPARFRSFTEKNKVQLKGEGVLFDIVHTIEGLTA
jgi:hypothetical protein